MKTHWYGTRSAAPSPKKTSKPLAISSAVTAVLSAIWLVTSFFKPVMIQAGADMVSGIITPDITTPFQQLFHAAVTPKAQQALGLAFAKDLVEKHFYWCDIEESEDVCTQRISRAARKDFHAIRIRWDRAVATCRGATIDHPINALSDQIEVVDRTYACLERSGFRRQVAALRAVESRGV